MLLAQVDALLGGARQPPRVVRTGMMGSGANAAALAARLQERHLDAAR
jgi:hypothetical protein